jgi:hypothetical protein
MRLIMAAILLLAYSDRSIAAGPDVFCLINPKCSLDKEDAEKSFAQKAGSSKKVSYRLGGVTPTVLVGAALKDVPRKDECFILELPATTIGPGGTTVYGKLGGDTKVRPIPVVGVNLKQTYKLWYCKDATAAPELLGQGIAFGSEHGIKKLPGNDKWELLPDGPAELARKKMVDLHHDIGLRLSNTYCDKIFAAKPIAGSMQITTQFGSNATLPLPKFMPSRVVADKDGNTIVEVDLHNRLPVYSFCSLSRRPSKGEQEEFSKLPKAQQKVIPSGLLHLELEPGEKKTARFIVPPMPNGVAMANESTITATVLMRKK